MSKVKQDNAMDSYAARITAWHARQARKLGDGNLSEGIRRAIEQAAKAKDQEKTPI